MSGTGKTGESGKVVFMAVAFFWVMGATNVCYFLPVFYGRQGYSVGDAGLLISAFYVTSLGFRLFGGNIMHRLGFRKLFLLAGSAAVLGACGMAWAGTNFSAGFLARALFGIGSSLFQIGLATYQALAFSEKVRGKAYSLIMAGCLLPMMTLVPAADWMLHRGLDTLYILMPLASSVVALILLPFLPDCGTLLPPARTGSLNPFLPMRECLRVPVFRVSLLAFFLFCLADATAAFMSGMTAHYGLMASYFLSSNAAIGVCVRLFFARVLDKYPRRFLSAPSILLVAGMLMLASFEPTANTLIITGMIFGVGMGFGFPLHLALVSDDVPEKLQPHAVSFSWFVMGVDFAMAPILLGWLGGYFGAVTAFRALCGVALAGACLTIWLWSRTKMPKTT